MHFAKEEQGIGGEEKKSKVMLMEIEEKDKLRV